MKVYAALQILKSGGVEDYWGGICSNIDYILRDDPAASRQWSDWKDICFSDWPESSRIPGYPVPGWDGRSATNAYMNADLSEMWDSFHPYGAARLRLLEHCIKWFHIRDI